MTYEKHEIEVVLFDESCVFTDLDVSGDKSGGIVVHSFGDEYADR